MKIIIMPLAEVLEKMFTHIPQYDLECEMNMFIILLIFLTEIIFFTVIM